MNQPEIRTIQEVEAEIHSLEVRLSQLRSERNSLLPIHKIPPEVFSHIFCLAAFSRLPKTEGDPRATVTSVSRYWRAVAIGCPILWSLIDSANPEWLGLCLERSQDHPLEVDNSNVDFNKPWPMALSPCISRTRNLQIKGFSPDNATSSGLEESGWAQPAPQLQTLDVRSSKLPGWLFAKSAPLLWKLALQWSQQDWDVISSSFRGLTALKIAQPEQQIPLHDLLVGLAGMTCLVDLELDRVIAPATQTPQLPSQGSDRSAPFKTLNLVIKDPESPVPVYAHLLNGLENRITDNTSVDVKIYEGVIQSQLFHISKALTGRSWNSSRAITEISLRPNSYGFFCQFRVASLGISTSLDDFPVTSLVVNFSNSNLEFRHRWLRAVVKEMKNHMTHLRELHVHRWSDSTLAPFGRLPNLENLTIPCHYSATLLDYPDIAGKAVVPNRTYPFPALKTLTLPDCTWLTFIPDSLRPVLEGRKLAGMGLEKLVLVDATDEDIAEMEGVADKVVRKYSTE